MDSFYIYRLPSEMFFHIGLGSTQNGIHNGFVVSSFYNRPEDTLTIVPETEFQSDPKDIRVKKFLEEFNYRFKLIYPIPNYTIFKKEYIPKVSHIVNSLDEGEKVVFSRTITGIGKVEIPESLSALSNEFPNAFVFCFFSPYTGLWIGATPEKLLQSENGFLTTVALAGTRLNEKVDNEWDDKNIEEQRMVVDYIAEVFNCFNLDFSYSSHPHTKKVGPIEHLETEFSSSVPVSMDESALKKLLYTLSPTPALCGEPKEKARKTISELEEFSRGFYGGFVGPYNGIGDFKFFVLLRSVQFSENRWSMHVGSGITKDSDPQVEWEETKRKGESILDKIDFIFH